MTLVERIKKFSKMSIASSMLLFCAAIAAAVVANSSLSSDYADFLNQEMHFRIGTFNVFSHGGHPLKVIEFINDGLMTLFFFMVGLEIKREVLAGDLSSVRQALLPILAALGGMIVPVLVYAFFNHPGELTGRGLAIPMATDIAFSLGVLSLLGTRVPVSLKIFLTALAVVDDIGGILVIAIFYSTHLSLWYLVTAAVMFILMYYLSKNYQLSNIFLFVYGIIVWYLFLQSGVHSTIAGVILAFCIRARPQLGVGKYIERIRTSLQNFPALKDDNVVLDQAQINQLEDIARASNSVIGPLQKLEHELHSAVNYWILPLFAFVNAGLVIQGDTELFTPVALGVALGLVVGKFVGVYSFTWATIKLGITRKPEGMNWANLAGVSLLAGIGFTVSLFIGNLSFGKNHLEFLEQAKLGVIGGSLVAGLLGFLILYFVLPKEAKEE